MEYNILRMTKQEVIAKIHSDPCFKKSFGSICEKAAAKTPGTTTELKNVAEGKHAYQEAYVKLAFIPLDVFKTSLGDLKDLPASFVKTSTLKGGYDGTEDIPGVYVRKQHIPDSVFYITVKLGLQQYTDLQTTILGAEEALTKSHHNSMFKYVANRKSKHGLATVRDHVKTYADFAQRKKKMDDDAWAKQRELDAQLESAGGEGGGGDGTKGNEVFRKTAGKLNNIGQDECSDDDAKPAIKGRKNAAATTRQPGNVLTNPLGTNRGKVQAGQLKRASSVVGVARFFHAIFIVK